MLLRVFLSTAIVKRSFLFSADDDGNDDDVTTLMTNCSIVDPITKQTMKDPVSFVPFYIFLSQKRLPSSQLSSYNCIFW